MNSLLDFSRILLWCACLLACLSKECKADDYKSGNCKRSAIQPLDAPHQFYIGPEIYHVKRSRGSRTVQTGNSFGMRAGYDFIKPFRLYFGIDLFHAHGRLKGETCKGKSIKSSLNDTSVEGRLGFTFLIIEKFKLLLTPYAGYGYFKEANHYLAPSPIHAHFNTKFKFLSAGLLLRANLTENLQGGLNIRSKWPLDPKCHVSHDPNAHNCSLKISEHFQYRIEAPLRYQFVNGSKFYIVALVPFYELRKYGEKANFPFDFLETEFNIYGITAEIFCSF